LGDLNVWPISMWPSLLGMIMFLWQGCILSGRGLPIHDRAMKPGNATELRSACRLETRHGGWRVRPTRNQ
jgi:hypothetical protein